MKDYGVLFLEIKNKVQKAQVKTVIAANTHMLFLYWEMGNYILKHQNEQGWGAKIIKLLAADLKKEFPAIKGFSARNLLYMKQFSEAYPIELLRRFVELEAELSSQNVFAQQLVAQMLSIDSQNIVIAQQPAAQLEEAVFSQSVVAKLT